MRKTMVVSQYRYITFKSCCLFKRTSNSFSRRECASLHSCDHLLVSLSLALTLSKGAFQRKGNPWGKGRKSMVSKPRKQRENFPEGSGSCPNSSSMVGAGLLNITHAIAGQCHKKCENTCCTETLYVSYGPRRVSVLGKTRPCLFLEPQYPGGGIDASTKRADPGRPVPTGSLPCRSIGCAWSCNLIALQ